MRRQAKVTDIHPCDANNQVITMTTPSDGPLLHPKAPCAECPYRKDRPRRAFPAEAFRHSAATSYDMAASTFACHMAGSVKPQVCAGFLLSRDAAHNMLLRMAAANGRYNWRSVSAGGLKLYPSYYAMAIANGVAKNDPVLAPCRSW